MNPFRQFAARKIAAIVLALMMLMILALIIDRFHQPDLVVPSQVQAAQ